MNKLDITNNNIVILNDGKDFDLSFLMEDFFDNSLDKLRYDIEICQNANKKNLLIQFAEKYENGELDFISDYWQNDDSIEYNSTDPSFEFGFNRDSTGVFTAHNVKAIHSGFWYAVDDLDKELKNIVRGKHIYEGFMVASEKIDIVISILKGAPDYESATSGIQELGLTRVQAEAVMSSRLDKLASYDTKYLQDRIACCEKLSIVLKGIHTITETESDMAFFAAKLRKSPMFQLSLSSKELFHSNFLYWIGLEFPDMFKYILVQLFQNAGKTLPLDEWAEGFKVKREHEHFDLCVTDKEETKVLLVIENKVKSIPNKAQLDNYYLKSTDAKHLLISLSTDFPEYEEIENEKIWAIANYKNLADVLSVSIENRIGYKFDIIRDYIGYISNFHFLVEKWKVDTRIVSNPFVPIRDKFKELRMNDFYVKYYFSQILIQITKEFNDVIFNFRHIFGKDNKHIPPSNNILYVNSGLTNSNGFLEVKVKIEPDIAILVQVQGNQYRRCVEYYYDKEDPDKRHTSLEKNIDCLRKDTRLSRFFVLEKGGELPVPYPQTIGSGNPFRKMKDEYRNGFCKYGNQFIYQYLNINNRSIDDIIKAVVEDVNNFRSIVGTNDSD